MHRSCGIYLLATAELICVHASDDGTASPAFLTAMRELTPQAVTGKRQEWLALLRSAMTDPENTVSAGE
jgi:hypothetical protein